MPKENYSTNPEWVQAVKREVDEVLLPRARAEMDSPDHLAAKAAEFITTDRILEDLNLEERLDAMVDRAMRRLAQMKVMKQISGSSEKLLKKPAPAADRRTAEAKAAKEQKVAIIRCTRMKCIFCELELVTY